MNQTCVVCFHAENERAHNNDDITMTDNKQTNTVSFHNSKSQHFKLSVSNPKSKYVAYLSVLSQFSNCQSLGRKNKHDFLKTDRAQLINQQT